MDLGTTFDEYSVPVKGVKIQQPNKTVNNTRTLAQQARHITPDHLTSN